MSMSPPLTLLFIIVIGFLVMMVLTAYMTRSLQLIFGSSKRAMTERAEELGNESDEIPMTAPSRSEDATPAPTPGTLSEVPSSVDIRNFDPPPRTQGPPPGRRTPEDSRPPTPGTDVAPPRELLPPQAPPPPPRSTKWAAIVASRIDLFTYGTLFLFVGLPVYYAAGYAMPMQLSFSVLTYFAAMAIPPSWRQYLHPVLVSSLCTVLGLWVLGLAGGDDLNSSLAQYRTGAKYSTLWSAGAGSVPRPGAGDMFGSVLDASIVALALPMFQYRRELRAHLPAIAVPNIVVAVGSLFAYPPLCRAIGIGAERSLAFAARSLTLALATPAAANLGGDANTVAALAIMSGILGVLIGQRMLGFLRIPEGK
ncbi:putative -domain-containing protein [Eutypa lata UCREL1]|uniref:Putative-domain-containing protein n=1 Tax=Eutypa lata (strain UCR-EL1) TaxID=1287681 RepID=M7TRZ5_EUTLA|nr:putative -domain-containing protein [Eutypa lata UCREL1]